MPFVHVANTNFEFELNQGSSKSIEENWSKNPLCLQLQFLPLLFAAPDDIVAVTRLPSQTFLNQLKYILNVEDLPRVISLQEKISFRNFKCVSWGPSRQVQAWASQHNIDYPIPKEWAMIRKINSKAFSFNYSPFSEAKLIHHRDDLKNWLNQASNPKVLKTCFGLSGIGHLLINESTDFNRIVAFCTKEWNLQQPLIGEPWLNRIFDFSTQWTLSPDGKAQLLGPTVFQTRPNGRYLGTFAGNEEKIFGDYLPFLYEHIRLAGDALQDLAKSGYFGHVGIDALLYRCEQENKIKLYPIVEINGRQTLSLVALRLQQQYYPDQVVQLSFQKQRTGLLGLLPSSLGSINFVQNLVFEAL